MPQKNFLEVFSKFGWPTMGDSCPPYTFGFGKLSENLSIGIWGWKLSILGKFINRIEILSTHDLLCLKCAVFVEKLQLFALFTVLTHCL